MSVNINNKKIGYIYKIKHKTRIDTPVYYGSTCNLVLREQQHRYNCNGTNYKKHNYYVYQFIRDYGGWDNWKVECIIEMLYKEKKELNEIEKLFIKTSAEKTLNSTIPNRSNKEWKKDNPEKVKNILLNFRLKNREKGNQYRREHYQKNKERIKQKNKEYYEANKKIISKTKSTRYNCICGSNIALREKTNHLNSKKHHIDCLKVITEGINNIN